jgi:hypothetical protein
MEMPRGYETDILMTLKAFSGQDAYRRKAPHKLESSDTWSLDVKSRNDKYRMLFYIDTAAFVKLPIYARKKRIDKRRKRYALRHGQSELKAFIARFDGRKNKKFRRIL